jgi:Cu/Ag efflux pump CusA
MSVLARWTIRPRLLGVQGVANVAIWGQRERQLQVLVDPERLRRAGVSLQQVIATTGNALWASPLTFLEANTPGTGGFIDTNNQRLGIQHLQPITTAADLAQVALQDQAGARHRLRDVARVVEDHQPLIGDAVLPGGPGLLLVFEKSPGANTVEVTRGVESALDALRPGLSGITIDPTIYRPATYVETATHNVLTVLAIGLVLLLLGLGAFFFDWRTVVVSLCSLVVSLSVALLVLVVWGTTINAMVVAGLVMAIGVVVDDAIVDTESVAARFRRRVEDGSSAAAMLLGILVDMRTAVASATLVIAVSVIPAFFLRGAWGAFLPPLLASFLVAIAASMLVALTFTPALAFVLLGSARPRRSPLGEWLGRAYRRAQARSIGAWRAVSVAMAATVIAGTAGVLLLRPEALPPLDDTNVVIGLRAPAGTSLSEMDRVTGLIGEDVRGVSGVRTVAAHVGRAIASDQVVGVDSGELWVTLDPGADHDVVLASIRHAVDGYPGLSARLQTYPNQRVRALLGRPADPVVVRVFGQDIGVLHEKAVEIRDAIAHIDGVVDPRVQPVTVEPTLDVKVDLPSAESAGIKPGDVRRAAASLVSGITVGSLFDQQKVFDVVVWGAPAVRSSVSSVRDLLLDTPRGGHVRLADVADVRIASTPSVIRHVDVSRSLDVTAAVRGRSIGAVLDDVRGRVDSVGFPLEYHAEIVGGGAQGGSGLARLLAVVVAASLGVFLLLQAAFSSWRLAAIALITLPFALTGGAVAALIDGRLMSLGTAAGLLGVLALAVRGSIVLLSRFQRLEREGGTAREEAILRGAVERVVPIVMTATLTALALLPMIVGGGGAGRELIQPMAAVILGGLVTTTVLNLFALPALCARFGSTPGADIFESESSQPRAEGPPASVTLPDLERAGSASEREELR